MKLSRKILSVALAGVTMFTMATASSVTASADWVETNGKTYYENEDGEKVTGWQTIDGEKYYFSSKGIMKTGWLTMKSGKKYYFKKDGTMVTGWLKKGGEKFYFNKKGVMATGFYKIGKKIYAFDNDGVLQYQCKKMTVYVGDKLYSLDEKGNLFTGVKNIEMLDGSIRQLYFGKNGYAITTKKNINGITYEFDAEKGVLDAYIKVKTGEFDNKYLELSKFSMKCEDVSANKTGNREITFSGYITNTSSSTLTFYIYANFYDDEGNLIDDTQLLSCKNLRPGEKYKFDDYTYVNGIPYRMEFTDYRIFD